MPNSKKSIPFIDYEPAEVKEKTGPNWRIVFRCRIPGTNKMKRFRHRVKKMASTRDRDRYAKRICVEINKKLERGWSPFAEETKYKEYKMLIPAMDKFLANFQEQERRGKLRTPTLKAYTSQIRMLKNFLNQIDKENLLCAEFTKPFVSNYLDYIYYDRKRSPRTVNNYLAFCRYLATLMVDREYLPVNTITKIQPLTEGKKVREIIDDETRVKIFKELLATNPRFLVCCLTVYYCFIRRTELTKLKVKHVQLAQAVINIPATISKNKKDDIVTIPKALIPYLIDNIKGANQKDFLFSNRHLMPGETAVQPKYISDQWAKLRKKLGFKETYQFYSLKDTGITKLFMMGIPTIKIRDQARHHDITITEKYTPRNFNRDDTIFSAGLDF
ncbi:MAG TPA: site-specific integrase [Leeuwenhoekiella sp.]|nr:site-specific integrase [Leeuwenhoekiella sp.]